MWLHVDCMLEGFGRSVIVRAKHMWYLVHHPTRRSEFQTGQPGTHILGSSLLFWLFMARTELVQGSLICALFLAFLIQEGLPSVHKEHHVALIVCCLSQLCARLSWSLLCTSSFVLSSVVPHNLLGFVALPFERWETLNSLSIPAHEWGKQIDLQVFVGWLRVVYLYFRLSAAASDYWFNVQFGKASVEFSGYSSILLLHSSKFLNSRTNRYWGRSGRIWVKCSLLILS